METLCAILILCPSITDGFPTQRVSNAESWYSLCCWPGQIVAQTVGLSVIWDTLTLMWSRCNMNDSLILRYILNISHNNCALTSLRSWLVGWVGSASRNALVWKVAEIGCQFLVPIKYQLKPMPTSSIPLKIKCRHFDEISITDCTESCHFDNFQCSQWRQFHQIDNISVSVTKYIYQCAHSKNVIKYLSKGINKGVYLILVSTLYPGTLFTKQSASYRKISWKLEAARFGFRLLQSLWNLTDTSAAALPRCLSNFRAIRSS